MAAQRRWGWASLRLTQRLRAELWGSCAVREDAAGANKHVLRSDSGAGRARDRRRCGRGRGRRRGRERGVGGGGGAGCWVLVLGGDLRREGAAATAARSNASGERSERPRSTAQGRRNQQPARAKRVEAGEARSMAQLVCVLRLRVRESSGRRRPRLVAPHDHQSQWATTTQPPPPQAPLHTLHALCQRLSDSFGESLHGNCSHTPPACAAARPSRVLWCLVPHLLPDHVRCTLGNCRCPRAGFTDTSSYLIHPTPSARAPIRPLGTLHHSRQSMSRGGKLAPEVNR